MIGAPPPGGFVCEPPFSNWADSARKQRDVKSDFYKLRDSWRDEVLKLALAYNYSLGLPTPPQVGAKSPLVVSGHQPYLYHPGVLYKYYLLTRHARAGGLALNISVDSDLCGGYPVKLPSYEGKHRKISRLMSASCLKSFYADSVLDKEEISLFSKEARGDLDALPEKFFEFGKNFLAEELAGDLPPNGADAMVFLRCRYAKDWDGAVLEAPLTQICKTSGFYSFAFNLFQNAEKFAAIFNAALNAYREAHKLRYPANPFPDLAASFGGVETLFWLVKRGERETLAARVNNGIVEIGGVPIKSAEDLRDAAEAKGWRIWPKAVALSLMNRLWLGDLFVHGLGGAKYDRITDEVISGFYCLQPPPFAVASLTVDSGLENPAQKLLEEKQKLREMDFHPELFLASPPADLLEEKRKVTAEIQLHAANKKELGKQLGRINAVLKAGLEPVKKEASEKIAGLEAGLNRYEVLADRELPFFLYPPYVFEAICATKG
jgi:hypothetical protein